MNHRPFVFLLLFPKLSSHSSLWIHRGIFNQLATCVINIHNDMYNTTPYPFHRHIVIPHYAQCHENNDNPKDMTASHLKFT